MRLNLFLICGGALFTFVLQTGASNGLSPDQVKLLQDPGGWEYLVISDAGDGVPTVHTCFDGVPHPEQCSGTLAFSANNTFVKNIHLKGGTDQRRGTYQLDGNQISFVDEVGEKDGPYDMQVNLQAKSLTLQSQSLRMELELEKSYKDNQKKKKAT